MRVWNSSLEYFTVEMNYVLIDCRDNNTIIARQLGWYQKLSTLGSGIPLGWRLVEYQILELIISGITLAAAQ